VKGKAKQFKEEDDQTSKIDNQAFKIPRHQLTVSKAKPMSIITTKSNVVEFGTKLSKISNNSLPAKSYANAESTSYQKKKWTQDKEPQARGPKISVRRAKSKDMIRREE